MQIDGQVLSNCRKEYGWRCYRTSLEGQEKFADLLLTLAKRFGRVMSGRNGMLIEPIVPRDREAAEERSLSATYGLDEMPMHIDTAHHLRPARYLLLGCVDPGRSGTQTRLAHVSKLVFTRAERSLLASAAVLVRTGKRSFYSTILDRDRPFFRYDPGCMEATDDRSADAMKIVQDAIGRVEVQTHDWQKGEILLLDNWKMLHGRSATVADSRLLFRVSVQ